jgi:hypothetical protein
MTIPLAVGVGSGALVGAGCRLPASDDGFTDVAAGFDDPCPQCASSYRVLLPLRSSNNTGYLDPLPEQQKVTPIVSQWGGVAITGS